MNRILGVFLFLLTFSSIIFSADGLHPLFKLEDVYPSNQHELKVSAMTFEGNDLYVTVLSPDRQNKAPFKKGEIFKVTGLIGNSDKSKIKSELIFNNLYEPTGITVLNGKIYVGEKDKISRLDDLNGDGKYQQNEKTVLMEGLSQPNFHTYTFGFEKITQGNETFLVGNFSTSVLLGGKRDINITINPKTKRGSTFIFGPVTGNESKEDVDIQYLAGGYRTPNGICLGEDQVVCMTDNQGIFNPSNKFIRVTPGSFYGHYLIKKDNTNIAAYQPEHVDSVVGGSEHQTPATVYLPQQTVARSPSAPMMLRNLQGANSVYNGQFLIGDVTLGRLNRVFMEEVEGVWQGAVFLHSSGHDEAGKTGFTAGPNRIIEGPDHNYYLGHIGAGGLWEFKGNKPKPWYGLQRLSFKKEKEIPSDFNEIVAVRDMEGGLELEFYKPVHKSWITKDLIKAEQWTYVPTQGYGGRSMGTEKLKVKNLKVSQDGKRVQLFMDGIRSNVAPFIKMKLKGHTYTNKNVGWVIHVELDAPKLWSNKFWYTMNKHKGSDSSAPISKIGGELDSKELAESIHKSVCIACHSTDGTKILGPSFKGLFGKTQIVIRDGKEVQVKVDETYLNRALTKPLYEHPKGFLPVMPDPVLGKKEQKAMVEFIKGIQ